MSQSRPSQEEALQEIRDQIDLIDSQIQELIAQRARCAQRVAEVKAEYQAGEAVFYRPEREAQVLRKVIDRNRGPLPDAEVARLFRELMSVCLAFEQPLQVACYAADCCVAQQAAGKQFGQSARMMAASSAAEALNLVVTGRVNYAVVARQEVLPALASSDLNLCGEVRVADQPFLVLGQQSLAASGEDKTALLVWSATEAELQALLDSTLLSLIPVHLQPEDAVAFYVELAGYGSDPQISRLLDALSAAEYRIKVFGSFPKAVL